MRKSKWLIVAGLPTLAGCPFFDPSPCGGKTFEPWDGGFADGGSIVDGRLDPTTCQPICGGIYQPDDCLIVDGGLVQCSLTCVGGRAPPGLVTLSNVDSTAGSWLARMAELEAAAVHAFNHLAVELAAHGLPSFARAARQAAHHEVQHAEKIARLAMRAGHLAKLPLLNPSAIRSLDEIAVDNAGEGCGRELFGAFINRHQSEHASDADVARVMGEIADEEALHAQFSFDLSEALMPRLSTSRRREAREAQEQVLASLCADEIPSQARFYLGLTDCAQSQQVINRLLKSHRV